MAPSGFFQPLVQPCFVDASGAAHDGIEQAGAEASGLVTGQINHDGDGPIDPDSAGPPNVLVHPKGFTLVSRCGSPVRAFASISMAFQAVCQSTPRCRASAETVVSSWARASVAQRGGAMSWISLNTPIGHAGSRQRHIRFSHRTIVIRPKHGASWSIQARRPGWPPLPRTTGSRFRSDPTPPSRSTGRQDHPPRRARACRQQQRSHRLGRTSAHSRRT
jgi:hypothetical protein